VFHCLVMIGCSIEKFLLRSIALLKFEWHKDCADIVASFVLKLEEPALLLAEAAVKAEAAVGTQRADPTDKDFHRHRICVVCFHRRRYHYSCKCLCMCVCVRAWIRLCTTGSSGT
jgi:hypothetical protein